MGVVNKGHSVGFGIAIGALVLLAPVVLLLAALAHPALSVAGAAAICLTPWFFASPRNRGDYP